MTNAELTILSLVAERPYHGYEIEQVIEARGMRDWTEVGLSSIYYLLKKLEGEGLISGQLEQGGRGPARKVFRLTRSGHEAWQAALLDALSAPHRCCFPVLLGLSCLPAIPPAAAQAALEQYRGALAAHLVYVEGRWANQQPLPYFVDAMFEHSIVLIQAELAWIDRTLQQMEANHAGNRFQEGAETVVPAREQGL